MEKKTNKAKLFSPKYLLYDITKILACPGLVWHRPKVVYESDKAKEKIRGGAILVANHLGFFDPIYMMYAVYYRRHHFICIKDFFESKAGFLFKAFQCIPIDRNNFDTSTLRGIADHLGSGELVSMFPEGHVSTDGGNMDVFKSGVVLMAMMAGVPIIPLYIKPKKHWYERIKMALGERIYVEKNMSFQKMQSVTEEIMQKENKLKELLEEK